MSITVERVLNHTKCYLVCHSDHFWDCYFSEWFIYYLCGTVRYSNCRLVADYIKIFCDIKSCHDGFLLQSVINYVCGWRIANLIHLNVNQTKVMPSEENPTCWASITNYVNHLLHALLHQGSGGTYLLTVNCISAITLVTYFLRQSGCWA
jgi:hypothetical protein